MTQEMTKTLSITSGKGGVGKSTITSNLAQILGWQGKRVLILDGDLSMANMDIMFGVRPRYSIHHVLNGEKELAEIITEVADGISLIPGGSGIYELQKLSAIQKWSLMEQVNQLNDDFDFLLIDTAPGIDDNVLYLNAAAEDVIVVLTADPASLADSYALIKVLSQRYKETRFSVVCNMVRDEDEAIRVFKRLSDVTSQFLCVSLDYKGHIPTDLNLRKATKSQQLIMNTYPRATSCFAIQNFAEKLIGYHDIPEPKGGMQFFWQQLVGVA